MKIQIHFVRICEWISIRLIIGQMAEQEYGDDSYRVTRKFEIGYFSLCNDVTNYSEPYLS